MEVVRPCQKDTPAFKLSWGKRHPKDEWVLNANIGLDVLKSNWLFLKTQFALLLVISVREGGSDIAK